MLLFKPKGACAVKIIGFIPARMNSSRYPGKPLVPICNVPMIEHVYRRSVLSRSLTDIYVATCDLVIREAVAAFGGKVVMTATTHQRGTDRIAEAASQVAPDADIVVNIQGDEPLIYPEMIDLAVESLFAHPDVECVNLAAELPHSKAEDTNEIKMVLDQQQRVLYFSRSIIPSAFKPDTTYVYLKQVCIISFRSDFLMTFARLPPTPLETSESIDMLRVLEHGHRIRAELSPFITQSVDTPADRTEVETIMYKDPLFKQLFGTH